MTPKEAYELLYQYSRETSIFGSMGAVLGWDQRVIMPPKGVQLRSQQMATLAGFLHERTTHPQVGEWLKAAEQGEFMAHPHSTEAANVRGWRREYDRYTKIPKELAMEMARLTSLAEQEWQAARESSDYNRFKPFLSQIVDLVREVAERLGYEEEPYDALLDNYEMGMKAREVEVLFAPLKEKIPGLVKKLLNSSKQPNTAILHRHYPRDRQESFVRDVVEQLGFEWDSGRLDPTVHPFASRIGPGDVRITTRYYEDFLNPSLFGSIHEVGHGLYEMGLPEEHFGTPMGESVSLGIHESQSRMWENFVGRSRAFWEYFYPQAQASFDALKDVSLDEFHFAINEVRPSTIRVEADEITYNLHIILRFELELALLRGDLNVDDLPAAWNERFKHYLGFEPPNDAEGVLQDIHWSEALIGYFPTYSLGNLYAAQLFDAAARDLGDLHAQFRRGEFKTLLGWLREKIHSQAQRYTPQELAERVTGQKLSAEPLLNYLENKFTGLYGV